MTVTAYRPEEFEREFDLEGNETLPRDGALNALARSARDLGGVEVLPARSRFPHENLDKDGSQFILISCALLERLCVDPDARDFALWMEGIANGNFSESFRCTDEQIASVFGYGERTVRLKRAALLAWQEAHDATIVQVTEHKFNTEKGKNDPTEYTVLFGRLVSNAEIY